MTNVLRPKLVYALTFSKTPASVVGALEGAFGVVLRNSLSVAKGLPWYVLAGSPEYEYLGYSRLTTEVTKGRLRLFQSMAVSKFATENDLGRAMTPAATCCGGVTVVTSVRCSGTSCSALCQRKRAYGNVGALRSSAPSSRRQPTWLLQRR